MTDEAKADRRLAAILMLDVAGFSAMMGRDDQMTTRNVIAFLGRVRTIVEAHGGRVVKTAGDSVFGEFESIVEAAECAATIQRSQAAETGSNPLMARIGLHVGDVLVHGDDLFGDGVNIAARLQPLAQPGGIAMSEAVFLEVGNRLGVPFQDGGPHRLKNIERPVRVYRVAPTAFGYPDTGASLPVTAGEVDLSTLSQQITGPAERLLDAVADRIKEQARLDPTEGGSTLDEEPEPPVPLPGRLLISGGFLVGLALGVFLILGRTSGWTTNALYPLMGCLLLGMSVGSLGTSITRRRGLGGLLLATGLVAGGFFLGSPVARVFAWIAAVAAFGAGLRRLGIKV